METNLNEFFNKLAKNPSKNYKVEQLKSEADNELLKQVIFLALDPFTQFYVRKIPEYTPNLKPTYQLGMALLDLAELSNRNKTGHEGVEWLRQILSSLSKDDGEVIKRIIVKDLKCGVRTSVNKVWKGLLKEYPVMLASAHKQRLVDEIEFPAIVQLKMDGMRFNAIVKDGKVEFRTRSGKELNFLGNLEKEFIFITEVAKVMGGVNLVFDGELAISKGDGFASRKEGNGILAKAIKGTISKEEAEKVRAILWDVIPYTDFMDGFCPIPYTDRFTEVMAVMFADKLNYVEHSIVEDMDSVTSLFEEYLSAGEEGIILKDLNSPWEDKRAKHQIKFKGVLECDLRITGVMAGTGKYSKMVGAIKCQSEDGILKVSVGSGLSDAQREEYMGQDLIGKIISIKYNERIENTAGEQSLFLPIFVEIREDKKKANLNNEIK